MVSVLIDVGGVKLEVGLVGREGMLGVPAALGSKIIDYQAVLLTNATLLQVPAEIIEWLMQSQRAVAAMIIKYMQAGTAQVAYNSFANGRLNFAQRIARWLLMVHDRSDGEVVELTHDVIAQSIGGRRPGVTLGLQDLEGRGVIKARRKTITIKDRAQLAQIAGPSYGPAERAYTSLFGRTLTRGH